MVAKSAKPYFNSFGSVAGMWPGRLKSQKVFYGRIKGQVHTERVLQKLRHTRQDMPKANAAMYQGNKEMARLLAKSIAAELDRKIRETGRTQRPGRRLRTAILDDQYRHYTVKGFAVGDFDTDPRLKLYARNLETGSSVHMHQLLGYGFWVPRGGGFIGPIEGGKDAVGRPGPDAFVAASKIGIRGYQIKIRNPIPAYHYMSGGMRNFERRYMAEGKAVRVYKKHFKTYAPGVAEMFFKKVDAADFSSEVVA